MRLSCLYVSAFVKIFILLFVLSAKNRIHLDVSLMTVDLQGVFNFTWQTGSVRSRFLFLSVIKLSRSISWRGVAGFVAWNWSSVWLPAVTLMVAAVVTEPVVRNSLSYHRSCRAHNIPLSYKEFSVIDWLVPVDSIMFWTGP